MTDSIWRSLIKALPPGLTISQAAKVFRRPYACVRQQLKRYGYKIRNGHSAKRRPPPPDWARRANWKLSNVVIAGKSGVSRERVRTMRKALGFPFVEARGRRPNKK